MPMCEKCWDDSYNPYGDQAGDYGKLVDERNASGHVCTPEQQAGTCAEECPDCKRMTLHQHCRVCMNRACVSRATTEHQRVTG